MMPDPNQLLTEDLQLYADNRTKTYRRIFVNWIGNHFRKDDTICILFSNEKLFQRHGT